MLSAIVVAALAGSGAVDLEHLPLGDGKYATAARKGYVQTCQTQFGGGGAHQAGPWIDQASRTWNLRTKLVVQGSVTRPARRAVSLGARVTRVSGNGLPSLSGTFPIAADDPAYQYDRNPNRIGSYTLSVRLPAQPRAAARATCVGGTVGVTTTGIPIYSAFDAAGRDAPAHEVLDRCGGHPERTGQYHYHALPSCWRDRGPAGGPSSLLGYALDGFGIYGPRDERGRTLSSLDLDVCHGRTSRVRWRGRTVRIYHYVATYDFPYFVACYRGTPVTSATGLNIGTPPPGGPPPG